MKKLIFTYFKGNNSVLNSSKMKCFHSSLDLINAYDNHGPLLPNIYTYTKFEENRSKNTPDRESENETLKNRQMDTQAQIFEWRV